MNAERLSYRIFSAFILILALAWTSSSCAPAASPTLFRPPSGFATPTTLSSSPTAAAPTPTLPPTQTFTPEPPTPIPPCTDGLTWLADLSFTDDTLVLPGQSLDKQWLVQNSGSCDWDADYKLRNINGETLGAAAEIPLFPARAGAQVTLRILFLAPSVPGTYRSEWQAVNHEGEVFGNMLYIQIIVSP